MKVTGKRGEEWVLDEGLRKVAVGLVAEFSEEVGYVDLQRIVFVRVSDSNAKWLGKCYYIGPPKNLLPWYAYAVLKKNQIIVEDFEASAERTNFLDDILSINYIIALNDAALDRFDAGEPGLREKQEKYTLLHELYHTKDTGEGIRKHDIEDFSDILRKLGIDWTQGVYDNDEDQES